MRNFPFLVHSTHIYLPVKMEQTECSEMSAYKLQIPRYYPKESIQHTEHGESLKSRMILLTLTTELKQIKCRNHSLEFKACVYAIVMFLYH
jgi:hypothetical protein